MKDVSVEDRFFSIKKKFVDAQKKRAILIDRKEQFEKSLKDVDARLHALGVDPKNAEKYLSQAKQKIDLIMKQCTDYLNDINKNG